ncbi:hypothetical protein FNQ90_24980 [Streptomyces alkaliphilus]|uniref:Uncharacterized protein n=1 Tax=Streptomyces alkaliphilus TaxID=1472722 RepID=A0A7W3Y3W9_9ACTN|nr:hypothetical protein [Streptomyces alkaliphilus]MBB0247284.1 hypothetical protein [Streptomyces alkaliphilus]
MPAHLLALPGSGSRGPPGATRRSEEYGRRDNHADLLGERVDGTTGG